MISVILASSHQAGVCWHVHLSDNFILVLFDYLSFQNGGFTIMIDS